MNTRLHRPKIACSLVFALVSIAGCGNESSTASITRIAAKLRPGDVKIVTDTEGSAAAPNEQSLDSGAVSPELIRTSAPDWQTTYSLSHAVLSRPDLKDDVAKWGVRAVLKDKDGNAIDTFERPGLDGQALLGFKDRVGFFTVELAAYEFVKGIPQDQLGGLTVFRIFRDIQGPKVFLEVGAAEDLENKAIKLTTLVKTTDEDAEPPTCAYLEFLTSTESLMAKVALAPSGKDWEAGDEPGQWRLNAKLDINLLEGMPSTSRLDCSDPTGNTSSTIVAIGGATRAPVSPQILFTPLGRNVSAVPRLAEDDIERLFLLENRKVRFDFTMLSQGAGITDPEVIEKKRSELTMLVEAKLSSAPKDEPARIIWSGAPELSKTLELPASLIGSVELKIVIRDTLAARTEDAVLLANTYKLFVSPAVVPSLELLQSNALTPAVSNRTVTLNARAVSNGLRYSQANFPELEMTQNGSTWTVLPNVSFAVTRTEAQATGAELWSVSFPYPFDEEKPLRLRLKGKTQADSIVYSNTSKRIFSSPALAESLPPLNDPSRSTCGATQSRLNVRLASKVACITGTGANARLSIAIENLGKANFELSTPSSNLSYAIIHNGTTSFGEVTGGLETLNQGGLLGRSIITVEVPTSKIPTEDGATIELEFDRIPQGAHSLAVGSYCGYDINTRPKLSFSRNDLALTSYVCDDEF